LKGVDGTMAGIADDLINEILELVQSILSESKVVAHLLVDKEYDDSIFDSVDYIPFHYSKLWKNFDQANLVFHANQVSNILFVFTENDEPKSFWRFDISLIAGRVQLGTTATSVLLPIFASNCNSKFIKKINKLCIDIVQAIAEEYSLGEYRSMDYGPESKAITSWHSQLRHRGANCEVNYDMYVNLGLEMAEIRQSFRSRYKSLVNQGEKLWSCTFLDSADESQWNEFHLLHTMVSGRETRSQETWNIQFEMIKNESAFAVLLRNKSDLLVGGGFFAHSRDEGIYFSGAYDRGLFPLPLGHVVQAKAISELRDRGVRWYFIGTMAHVNGASPKPEKEASISNFKEGFATHIFPRYILTQPRS
jgi:FemAB family protein